MDVKFDIESSHLVIDEVHGKDMGENGMNFKIIFINIIIALAVILMIVMFMYSVTI